MTNFVNVIKACEAANGAGTKKIIFAALETLDEVGKRLVKEALDPYRVFGVRKFDTPAKYASYAEGSAEGGVAAASFLFLLSELAKRKLTGNAAKEAVTKAMAAFTEEDASYYVRILDKDLKAGFSGDTVNKIFKDLVPSFTVMLADKCESTEEFEKYISFPCQADFKYDGQRTICVVTKTDVVYYARSGKLSEHLNGLFDLDLHKIHDMLGYDFVMDGEAFASDFTETMNAKKEGNSKAKENLRLRAFFLMPMTDWLAQDTKITMRHNRFFLEEVLKTVRAVKVILSEGREVDSYADMMAYCNEVIDVHKQEGLILKNWDSTYQWDRTFAWTKVKRFYDVDAKVTGFYAGRPKSRLENTLGGISIEGQDEHGRIVICNVGSGFSDEMRAEIWNNKDKYLGQTVVVKYQEISRPKNSETWALRFPTFEHFRDDK